VLLVCFEPGEELRAAGASAASAEYVQKPNTVESKSRSIR
jgi:hypothetical protein